MISEPFKEIEKVFKEDKARNAIIANYVDLKRKDQPYLSLPGLKRFCDNHIKFRKVIIETEDDVMETKMWFRGNNEIPFSEIVKIKRKEPQERQSPEQMKSGITWAGRTGEDTQTTTTAEPALTTTSLKFKVKKSGMTEENRMRASERMKAYHAAKKEKKEAKNAIKKDK